MSILKGIPFLRQELTKIFMKRAADKSGIMRIPFKNKDLQLDIEDRVQKYIRDAEKQGVDLDMVSNENLKYTINLNENVDPISRAISADSPEGRKITEALLGKRNNVVDMTGKKIDTSQGIVGGKSMKELMESGQVTKGTEGIKKSKKVKDREMFQKANEKFNKTDAQIKAEIEASNKKYVEKIKDNRKMTDEEYAEFIEDIGGEERLEAFDFDGTVGSGKKILKEDRDYFNEMELEYKKRNLDPKPGEKYRKEFLQKKLNDAELSGDKRLMSREEREELFDLENTPVDPEDMADGGVAGLLGERTGYANGNGVADEDAEKAALGKRVRDLMDDGYDFGEAVKKAMEEGYAQGGPARQNFAMGRRAFLKLMGGIGAGIGAAKAGLGSLFKAGKPITKAAEIVTPAAKGKPAWFDALVTRVINEGDDVTKKFATKDREIVHTTKIDDDATVTVYRDLNTDNVRVDIDDATKNVMDDQGNATVSLEVRSGKSLADETTGKTTPGNEFEAVETDYRNYMDGPDDFVTENVENVVSDTKDLTADLTKVKLFAKGQKKPTIKEIMIQRDRAKTLKQAEDTPAEYAADRGPDYDPSDYATGGRVSRSGGGIMKLLKLLKFKPKKLETVKDFISKRQFLKSMVGNTEKNKKARELKMLKEAVDKAREKGGFKFKDVDVEKDIRPIFDQSKDRTLNSTGGLANMLGE